jgi:hypothetical protein
MKLGFVPLSPAITLNQLPNRAPESDFFFLNAGDRFVPGFAREHRKRCADLFPDWFTPARFRK